MSTEVTTEEILQSLTAPLVRDADLLGLTPEYLLRKLKRELNARKQREFVNKRGEVVQGKLMPDWDIRQRARMDAHRLLNHYPIEQKVIHGTQMINIGERLSRALEAKRAEISQSPKIEKLENQPLDVVVLEHKERP